MARDDVAGCASLLEELSQTLAPSSRNPCAISRKKLIRFHYATNIAATTDRNTLAVVVQRHVALDAIIHYPVFASIWIDPDCGSIFIVLRFSQTEKTLRRRACPTNDKAIAAAAVPARTLRTALENLYPTALFLFFVPPHKPWTPK